MAERDLLGELEASLRKNGETWVIEKKLDGEWHEVGRRTTEPEAKKKFEYERIWTAPEIEMRVRKV